MNDHAKAWVEALRSGEFKQAQKQLRKDGKYCCLGVACELYRRETKGTRWDGDTLAGEGWMDIDETTLPVAVGEWLGLASDEGRYKARNGRSSSLAQRNDQGASFDRIADIIESEPEGLFFDV